MLPIKGIENLCIIFANFRLTNRECPFEIKGFFVRDKEIDLLNVHESPNIEHLPFSDKRNQAQPIKRKRKSFTETLEEKEKRLIAGPEYEKRRRANEVKILMKRKKCANESSESSAKRLATQSQYQRQNIANEVAECREESTV